MTVNWDAERISALENSKIEALRANALRMNKQETVLLCDEELAKRRPQKEPRPLKSGDKSRLGEVVVGFHFVCDRGRGVTNNDDGTFWTGTWVVAERNAAESLKNNGYVALHESKSDLSYLQGTIKQWRRSDRENSYSGQPAKRETGIEFLITPTTAPLKWTGYGAGEKGYNWSVTKSNPASSIDGT